jgi:hypothetical protein
MKIRMVEERTGPRHDGRAWPPRGEDFYVEDDEGAAICGAGWAVPAAEERAAETRPAPATEETRAGPKSRAAKQG